MTLRMALNVNFIELKTLSSNKLVPDPIGFCYAHQLPGHLSYYIDYERFASDLFIYDYCSVTIDGHTHIFSNY